MGFIYMYRKGKKVYYVSMEFISEILLCGIRLELKTQLPYWRDEWGEETNSLGEYKPVSNNHTTYNNKKHRVHYDIVE